MFKQSIIAAIAIVILSAPFTPLAFGQAERITEYSKTFINEASGATFTIPGGKLLNLSDGIIATQFAAIILDRKMIVKTQTQLRYYGTDSAGVAYQCVGNVPYHYMGDVDSIWWNFSSRSEMTCNSGSEGHFKIAANFHSQFDGENLKILVDSYRVEGW